MKHQEGEELAGAVGDISLAICHRKGVGCVEEGVLVVPKEFP